MLKQKQVGKKKPRAESTLADLAQLQTTSSARFVIYARSLQENTSNTL